MSNNCICIPCAISSTSLRFPYQLFVICSLLPLLFQRHRLGRCRQEGRVRARKVTTQQRREGKLTDVAPISLQMMEEDLFFLLFFHVPNFLTQQTFFVLRSCVRMSGKKYTAFFFGKLRLRMVKNCGRVRVCRWMLNVCSSFRSTGHAQIHFHPFLRLHLQVSQQ